MGKKTYSKSDISKEKTKILGIDSLQVLEAESNDTCFHVVHKRYFRKEKCACPACHSTQTRSSKVIARKFKDILEDAEGFRIVDLIFHQRYMRCDGCKSSVFPEDIDFAEKGCRYTNRLSDKLAEGTFRYSYKKVCDYYGVPASTASVGAIMRRQIQYRESRFPRLETPHTIAIIELHYFRNTYPLILSIDDSSIYCIDILKDTSETSYINFFRTLDASKLNQIYIEPNVELASAVATCFPCISPLISQECIFRHGRNAFIEIIHSDGKRFPVVHKDTVLTQNRKFITSKRDKTQIKQGMSSRERLSKAYEHYQSLLGIFENTWDYSQLSAWASKTPDNLNEFIELIDIIEFHEKEIQGALSTEKSLPENFSAVVQGICDAIDEMPHCIFDVLRARCMLTSPYDTIVENDETKRLGIPVERFIENIKDITNNIKEERDYEL